MCMDLLFLPFHYHVALASKKKSKVRKEVKPAKSQGRKHGHPHSFSALSLNVLFAVFSTHPANSKRFIFILPAAEEDSDDMFKPPKMDDHYDDDDDEFSPFGGKSGLFSGGKGLFDDDDEVMGFVSPFCVCVTEAVESDFIVSCSDASYREIFSLRHQNLRWGTKE